ncbi:MAG: hypothetical protein JW915_10275 [Chitinispirillaceae bacterium]|nr:hypothetical protein [Chitinispirillaceae bacterium]
MFLKNILLFLACLLILNLKAQSAQVSDTTFNNSSLHRDKPVKETCDTISELPRLTVTPEKTMLDAFSTTSSEFKAAELLNTAGTGNDINRVLSLHPAATIMNTVDNNSLNIRGGDVVENLYIIDGIEFETINHYSSEKTSGAIGFITADNVDRVRINMVMQPSFTPRNSSVIEIDLKDIPEKRLEGQVDLNISGLSLQMQGKTGRQSPAFLFNCRWMDLKPLEMFTRGVWSQYGDLLLKATMTLNDNQSLGLVSVGSYDKMRSKTTWDERDPDAIYQKELLQAGGGIYHEFSKDNVHNRLTLSAGVEKDEYFLEHSLIQKVPVWKDTFVLWVKGDSVVRRNRSVYVAYKDSFMTILLSDSYKNKFHILLNEAITLKLSNSMDIEAGARINGKDMTNTEGAYDYEFGDSVPWVYEAGGYIQGQLKRDKMTVMTGVRCDYFSSIDDFGIAPYLGYIYDNMNFGIFKLQCAYSYQEPPIFRKYYHWLFIKPYDVTEFELQRCVQGSLLYENCIMGITCFSAEIFGKLYNREYPYVRPYIVSVDTFTRNYDGSRRWKIKEADGKKAAAGIEICIHNKTENVFRYRLALSMGKVKNRFTDKRWYNDENDIRAALKMVVSARLKKYHNFSFATIISDGMPYSDTDTLTPKSEWFVRRFDPTFFMSFRYSFIYTGKRLSIGGYVDVQNILNQTHTIAMQEIDTKTRALREMDGILPTAGLTVSF